ncbi:MAG: hypothetical protein JWO36_6353 [Myxococcales bacterium]|nr:hypothetical protein [Myxococcales bacterium]
MIVLVCACGDNRAAPDARPDVPGIDAFTYPAFAPPIPQVRKGIGHVMPAVRVVPIFYPGDAMRTDMVSGLGKLQTAQQWSLIAGEYGVGPFTLGTPIDLTTAAPTAITDDQIRLLLASGLDGTHPEWGPTDAATIESTIYTIYFPTTTTVTGPGTSCVNFAAYHNTATQTQGHMIYAVMPRCGPLSGHTAVDTLFAITTHELYEAATDPHLDAYTIIGSEYYAWPLAMGGIEVGDMCAFLGDNYFTDPEVGYLTQRIWSNHAASAFHDPCLPIPSGQGPYFAAVPETPDLVTLAFGGGQTLTMDGVNIPLLGRKTIKVRLASEAPLADWTVAAIRMGRGGASPLAFQLDRTSGHNGDTLLLTITALSQPASKVQPFALISTLDGRNTIWAGVVGITP